MSEPEQNESAAIKAYKEAQGWPVEKVVERANKALADKEWMTAHILFAHASKQAIILSAHCMKQATAHLQGLIDGQDKKE